MNFIIKLNYIIDSCFPQNDEDRDGEAALRHVLLLDPETEDTPWAFKSRLITANSVESSEKFYVQVSAVSTPSSSGLIKIQLSFITNIKTVI